MSRVIKFRAWSNEHNKYCDLIKMDEDDRWYGYIYSCAVYLSTKDIILEQYTGLKDKNGKEIYEGDIVNLEYYERPEGKKRWHKTYPRKGTKDINVVGFEDGYFKFYEGDENGYGSELSFSDYGEWGVKDGTYKYVATIIGNIHENPELLGGEE